MTSDMTKKWIPDELLEDSGLAGEHAREKAELDSADGLLEMHEGQLSSSPTEPRTEPDSKPERRPDSTPKPQSPEPHPLPEPTKPLDPEPARDPKPPEITDPVLPNDIQW
jgi:hypothetical protein